MDCSLKWKSDKLIIFQLAAIYLLGVRSDPSPRSYAWGPGLDPSFVLPVRYFFIRSVDKSGRNITEAEVPEPFIFSVNGLSGQCGVFREILDRKDGTYIARYRTYNSCQGLRLEVRLRDGQHIRGSPWIFNGIVPHIDCDCPLKMADWKTVASCSANFPQIDRDLGKFRQDTPVDVSEHFRTLSKHFHPQSASFCHYMVKNGALHRKCFGEHVGFAGFMDSVLLFLLRRADIPDVNFIANLGDYPLSPRKKGGGGKFAVFSWCGSTESFDIVMPTYDMTESSLTAMDRVMLDLMSVQATKTPVWSEKTPKAFWRGRDAREERLRLVELARENPDVIDAALTNFFFFRDQEAKYGPTVQHVDFHQFFQFKYQINLDGTVAAYRFPYLLGGDSLVFKQESPYYEYFYADLLPWTHYIPVQRNLSDLTGKINWAKDHDAESQMIARNGADYVRNNLMPQNVFCYYTMLLETWSKLVLPIPDVPDDFELISQTKPPPGDCLCGRNRGSSDKTEL